MLTAKVRRFAEDFDAGRATLSLDLLNFLRDWLYQHIRKSDAQYVQYVRETKFHQVRM
jgi:methyl-accepting chemotaxis protein